MVSPNVSWNTTRKLSLIGVNSIRISVPAIAHSVTGAWKPSSAEKAALSPRYALCSNDQQWALVSEQAQKAIFSMLGISRDRRCTTLLIALTYSTSTNAKRVTDVCTSQRGSTQLHQPIRYESLRQKPRCSVDRAWQPLMTAQPFTSLIRQQRQQYPLLPNLHGGINPSWDCLHP